MSKRPLLLDLFSGAGGCAMGYHRAGFDVVGCDIKPQRRYPFPFVEGDALELLACLIRGGKFHIEPDGPNYYLEDIACIHASPPCQAFSSMKVMKNAREHHDLLTPTRNLLKKIGKLWVIENVPGSPIVPGNSPLFCDESAITLCGTMFNLNNGKQELRRHRLFESSIILEQPVCRHRLDVIGFYGDHARTRQRTIAGNRDRGGDIVGNQKKMPLVRDLMGIDWMTWHEAVLAIPPAYTEFIGLQLIDMCGS